MEECKSQKTNVKTSLYKLVDSKQPEVKWAFGVSIALIILLFSLNLYLDFQLYENEICNILNSLVGGIIAFIGVAIAGIAIVIAMFSPEQIKTIEKIEFGAFERLLYDFKWFGLISAIEVAILIAIILIIRSSYSVAPPVIFFLVSFFLLYTIFYLIFYGCALIGNCIKLSKIRLSLNQISTLSQDIPLKVLLLEFEFLVSKIFKGSKSEAHAFYSELIQNIEQSTIEGRDEILQFLKNRYM